MTEAPRKATRLKKLGVFTLSLVVTFLIAEYGLRFYLWIDTRPYSSAGATHRLDELVNELRGLQFVPDEAKGSPSQFGIVLHPYQGFQIVWNTQMAGLKHAYFESAEAEANFDVILIGGSVAAQLGNYVDKYLTPELQKDPRLAGRTIKYFNLACPGHKQPQAVLGLQWLLSAGWKPDAVILLDGYNDVAISIENSTRGVHPGYPSWAEMQMRLSNAGADMEALDLKARLLLAQAEAEKVNAELRRWPVQATALTGTFAVHWLGTAVEEMRHWRRELRKHESEEMRKSSSLAVTGPSFEGAPDKVLDLTLTLWRESSRSMQAICRDRNIPFLHVLQPAACDVGSKPLTDEEKANAGMSSAWGVSITKCYPRLRETGKELERDGVNFLDASYVFADHPEKIYTDGCHFGPDGCAILSARIAEAFLRTWRP